MKKLMLIIALSLLCIGSAAHARSVDVSTVAKAKAKSDAARIVLEGRITEKTGDEDEYWLSDETGRIRVYVDDDYGQLVGKKVRITGEIDRDDFNTKVDAQHLTFIE